MSIRMSIMGAALIVGCEPRAFAAIPLSSIYANPGEFRGESGYDLRPEPDQWDNGHG